ncbi:MAG: ATP-binding protein [Myxococcales bacterium]|nr:ATP-binding protein [Myxococcales bacterium]
MIREAEDRRRRRAAVAVGAVYLASNLTFFTLSLLRGEWVLAIVLAVLAVATGAVMVAARAGHTRLAGFVYAGTAIGAVMVAPIARGNPGYASFFMIVGVMLGAVILPARDALVVYVLGLFGEVVVLLTPVTQPALPTLGGVYAEGTLLYAVVGLIAVAMAASLKQLVDDLMKRDEEARVATQRAEELSRQLDHSQRMEALGRLAGGIAHDFNNLLTVMQSCSSLLAPQVASDGTAKQDLADLDDAVTRAASLTRQLLAFARRDVVPTEAVDVAALLARLSDLLRRLLGTRVTLELVLPEAPCHVMASASQIEQVVMNLVVNARDAMGGAGALTITLQRRDDTTCALLVRDSGPGLTDAVKARIFEPFFTTKGQGTGLGLSTVYGIVTRLGGAVRADSAPGQGTTFTVTMTLTEPPALVSARPTLASTSGALSILVVDDEPVLREQVVRMLTSAGHQARAVATAAEALADPALASTDVLVTDLQLGVEGADGVWLARRLLERRPSMRIVLVSGFTAEPAATGPLIAQGARFIAKPFTAEVLLGAVSSRPATPQR